MMLILLAILHNRSGGNRKIDVINIIQDRKWFDKKTEDIKPMPSSQSKEARWITLFAFCRKDCVEQGFFIDDGIEDSWQISKEGINTFVELREQFQDSYLDSSKCYMWSLAFKQWIDPKYKESNLDLDRPDDVYKDYGHTRKVNKYLDILDQL